MAKIIDIHRGPAPGPMPAVSAGGQCVTGWLVWREGEVEPRVDFVGNAREPLPLRATVELPRAEVAGQRCEVVLVFERGRFDQPIVIGVLRSEPVVPSTTEVLVDGQRVELEARDELVLRCGSASIVLRRNGRMVLRGAYVETRAEGTNRIRGGNVAIN